MGGKSHIEAPGLPLQSFWARELSFVHAKQSSVI